MGISKFKAKSSLRSMPDVFTEHFQNMQTEICKKSKISMLDLGYVAGAIGAAGLSFRLTGNDTVGQMLLSAENEIKNNPNTVALVLEEIIEKLKHCN